MTNEEARYLADGIKTVLHVATRLLRIALFPFMLVLVPVWLMVEFVQRWGFVISQKAEIKEHKKAEIERQRRERGVSA